MTIPEQLKQAYNNKDWGAIIDILAVFGVTVDEIEEVMIEKIETKVPVKRKQKPTTTKALKTEETKPVEHLFTESKNVVPYAPLVIHNRPNKFAPEEYIDTKKYTVPKDKKFGKFAGKTFSNEEEYLKTAVYSQKKRRQTSAARKVTLTCSMCHRSVTVFESETTTYEDTKFKCDACLAGRSASVSVRSREDD